MPTVQQLPQAVSVNPTDAMMLDQDGVSVAATVAQVIAAGVSGITLTGDLTGSGTNTILTTLAPVTTPGTFSKVTVNAKGQVTGGGAVAAADVVGALGYTPYNAANTAGYVASTSLATVATSGSYADLIAAPALGGMATQSSGAVAITGGTVVGADLSAAVITAAGTSQARAPATASTCSTTARTRLAWPTARPPSAPR